MRLRRELQLRSGTHGGDDAEAWDADPAADEGRGHPAARTVGRRTTGRSDAVRAHDLPAPARHRAPIPAVVVLTDQDLEVITLVLEDHATHAEASERQLVRLAQFDMARDARERRIYYRLLADEVRPAELQGLSLPTRWR